MAKVIKPFFPKGIGCLKFIQRRNLKGGSTHVVLLANKKRKVVSKND